MNTLYKSRKGRLIVLEHIMEIISSNATRAQVGIVMTSGHFVPLEKEDIDTIIRLFERN